MLRVRSTVHIPEKKLLPWFFFDDIEFVVMSKGPRHFFICHVDPILYEKKNH